MEDLEKERLEELTKFPASVTNREVQQLAHELLQARETSEKEEAPRVKMRVR